ncbi:MAG: glycoside hydrolase [Prevotella sp.]|jgi:hypothetical protein|nr:glycoside hydrolase [Prevotella sp.]
MNKILILFISLFFLSCSAQEDNLDALDIKSFNSQNVNKITETKIFDSNDIAGKPYSRIPTIIIANNGNILAACEKRKDEHDKGEIDILLALSEDGGKTYFKTVLFEYEAEHGRKMNPCFVIDRNGTHGKTGRIYCFVISSVPTWKLSYELEKGEANTLYRYSDDDGLTWSETLTLEHKIPKECTIFGPSPSNGIQLENGTLVIPAFITLTDRSSRTGIIFKTPNGKWEFNYINLQQSKEENESTIIALGEGNQILLNTRTEKYNKDRHIYYSNNIEEGMTGKEITWNIHSSNSKFRISGPCQGSLEVTLSDLRPVYLFSHPYNDNPRRRICIWKSFDLEQWTPTYLLTTGRSAGYSVLTYYKDKLLAIYESDPNVFECTIQDLSPLLPLLTNDEYK